MTKKPALGEYSRTNLINLCERAVVHHSKWHDRDSNSAQQMISSIYEGLTAGLDFIIDEETDEETIIIEFINIDLNKLKNGIYLPVCDIDDYFAHCDPNHETEMFEGFGIQFDSSYTSGYMPTKKRLDEANNDDWCNW